MQMVENLQETALAEDDNKLLDVLVKAYAEVLQNKELESSKALKNEQQEVRKDHNVKLSNERKKMEADKDAIRKKLGGPLFDDVYSFLIHHRS